MKILILGSGLMGPAAAYNAIADPDVDNVTLCDFDRSKLDAAIARLAGLPGGEKLAAVALDLNDHAAAVQLFAGFNVVLAALPWQASALAFRAALDAHVPIVDLAIPEDAEVPELRRAAEESGGLIALGCGLEPGLTEIVARHMAREFDRVDELHIKCGGVPAVPTGPLAYKIVFGGRQLPLRDIDALAVEGGQAHMVKRYSGVEPTTFDGVGECESWHEGMMPWLLEMDEFKEITEGTQKTIRWPGYAAKASVLLELGLLGRKPVEVGAVRVVPKDLVDTLLYPFVKLEEGEHDITLFRVDLVGTRGGKRVAMSADMVDRYDPVHGFTSMARTTAFTGAIIARMIGRGDIKAVGLYTSEALVAGPLYDRLIEELAKEGIVFEILNSEV
jgi:saccharopine dehydrogenase-like NADP-dependent oxidoreductase